VSSIHGAYFFYIVIEDAKLSHFPSNSLSLGFLDGVLVRRGSDMPRLSREPPFRTGRVAPFFQKGDYVVPQGPFCSFFSLVRFLFFFELRDPVRGVYSLIQALCLVMELPLSFAFQVFPQCEISSASPCSFQFQSLSSWASAGSLPVFPRAYEFFLLSSRSL